MRPFFTEDSRRSGPPITDVMVKKAESTLGVRLPAAYVDLLRERNGGVPRRRRFPTKARTSRAEDNVEVAALLGIGFPEGLDGELGSRYLVHE